ncbi:hypothetical protein IWW55_005252 [Coemansia sp. RSA 2706]|nr:hypothetical protein IWW55_005252 [Coemansia sp. RSA 2706]KAJ2308806.1 hypothetical protein IWW52_005835 [Coemansia sp. RSA 2704]KAJ2309307.1 hypothetical protein IWW54_003802 [Coemansia sp. RSA 2705]KAJ2320299.1 hypothetical protein IWW51_004662 [Coemansia sp. RSA 2702]KAJ2718230.1 hypothetical protein H4R23_005066 [Coemansia sp. Cherry 401B]
MASASHAYLPPDAADTLAGRQSSDDQRLRAPNSGEEGRSSSEALSRPKRAQVKNACVNCQKACKKCDSGRPCQRCVKYNLAESCVDSKRKPRKKGIKRGPYKKRKKNPEEGGATATTMQFSTEQLPPPMVSGSSTSITGQHTPSTLSRSASQRQRQRRQPRTLGERAQRPPQILGPGAIPILHTDPTHEEYESDASDDESNSDVPLVFQHASTSRISAAIAAHAHLGQPPETPTSGLATAFSSLATGHPRIADPHHRPPTYAQTPSGSIRLPPIESFDQAQALGSPPNTSSLAILTDVALGRTTAPPSTSVVRPQQQPLMHPPLPRPPSGQPHNDDIGQESRLQPPDDPHSRYTTSTADSDFSNTYGSSFDSRQSPDPSSRSYIRRLSHRLHNTHIEQEPADT